MEEEKRQADEGISNLQDMQAGIGENPAIQGEEMTNPQKVKGDAYERTIVDYLRACGFRADRTRAGWTDDRGDIHGISRADTPFTLECKNHRGDRLPGWIDELCREIANNQGLLGAVIHKKHGTTDAGGQYATMPLWMLAHLLKQAGYE